MSISPDKRNVNKATFINKDMPNSLGGQPNQKDAPAHDSPRNTRYQSVNEYDLVSQTIDNHLDTIRAN